MLESARYTLEETKLAKRHIITYILQSTAIYIIASFLISLFAESTLLWMFLATASTAAWSMYRIATHTIRKYREASRIDSSISVPPFTFFNISWLGTLAPIIGSGIVQLLYFKGIGPMDPSLLAIWIISNIFLTSIFAIIGAICMRVFIGWQQHSQSDKKPFHRTKHDTSWIDRITTAVVLFIYSSSLLLTAVPIDAACPKGIISEEQLIECYEPDTQIGTKGQDKEEQVEQNMLIDESDISGAGGEGPKQNPQAPQPDKLEEFTEEEPNLLVSAGKGLWELGEDFVAGTKKNGAKAGAYISENWNKPGKVVNDVKHVAGEFAQSYNEGAKNQIQQKKNQSSGFWSGAKKKVNAYGSDFFGELKKDIGWANNTIFKPHIKNMGDTLHHLKKHPEDITKFTDVKSMTILLGQIYIENNYKGGTKQLNRDLSKALEDKNTYPAVAANMLGMSEETQQLFKEERYSQALGRGSGEVSVEAGIELTQTLASGGAKGIVVVAGFVVDASKAARKLDKVSDTVKVIDKVGDYEKLPRRMLPDVKVPRTKYKLSEDTSNFSDESLQHLFDGDAKRYSDGNISIGGFHHEGENSIAKIKEGTKIEAHNGVYQAEVEYLGYSKNTHPQGFSTFFPKSWSRNDVIKSINETYQPQYLKEIQRNGNAVYENTVNGVKINVIVNTRTNKVITSYPVWPQ